MDNIVTVNDFTFEISTAIKKSGVEIGLSLKSIGGFYSNYLKSELPIKRNSLKYCRHSKKRQKLIKWINQAERYLSLEDIYKSNKENITKEIKDSIQDFRDKTKSKLKEIDELELNK